MNYWTDLSIQYANQRNYLDDLFAVYPTIPNGIREIDKDRWTSIEQAFNEKDDEVLIKYLLHLDLFPIKDSYVAFLKRAPNAIKRNPKTVKRLCGRLYEMGLDKILKNAQNQKKQTDRLDRFSNVGAKQKLLELCQFHLMNLCQQKKMRF